MRKKTLHTSVKKLISITMIIIIIYTIINPLIDNRVYAQTRNTDVNNIYSIDENLYPGYSSLLQKLKATHPNWTFTLFYTDLEWADVLKGETIEKHERSLVSGKTGEWLCTYKECAGIPHDGNSWFGASQTAVAYYLDPRNFLTEDKIFQFESLSYVPSIHTEEGVEKILKGTFMSNKKMCDYYGNSAYGGRTFAQAIMYAAQESNVSPYHIASRIRQEVVVSGGPSSSVSGTVSGYEGLFNFCNIGATPTPNAENPSGDSVINGLIYARNKGWTNPEIGIVEAAKWIGRNYISIGQNSLYLQKWDLIGTPYEHQYMTNIQAAESEASTIANSYKSIFGNLSNTSFNFIIPMYKHIPATLSRYPSSSTFVSQNAQLYDYIGLGVRLRKTPNGDTVKYLYNGAQFLRIELKASSEGSNNWDKVMLPDGTMGYIATQFITEVPTNEISKTAYIKENVNLLNAPRIIENGSTAIRLLYYGQSVTIKEEGKYSFDGYEWVKVSLEDGTTGYIQKNYIAEGKIGEDVKVTCNTELAMREGPGLDYSIKKYIDIGVIVTRLEKATEKADGYYWDKIITSDGTIGYMARERYNPYALWLTPVGEAPITGEKVEVNETDKIIKAIPQANLADVQQKYSSATITSGTEKLETGAIISINGVQYTVIKLGDVSGDGIVDAIDLLKIRKYLIGKETCENEFFKSMDVYTDGVVDAKDLLKIRKVLTKTETIQLN